MTQLNGNGSGILNSAERPVFDDLAKKIDAKKRLNKEDHRFIRQLAGQGKIARLSKRFKSREHLCERRG